MSSYYKTGALGYLWDIYKKYKKITKNEQKNVSFEVLNLDQEVQIGFKKFILGKNHGTL